MRQTIEPDDPANPEVPPFASPDAGLVQIRNSSSLPIGMGFLVTPDLVVTCAHVVNAALDRDPGERAPIPPSAEITVTFPLAPDEKRDNRTEMASRMGRVLRFVPPGRLPGDDIALLRLDKPAPAQAGVTILADVRNVAPDNDELGIFGAPMGTTLAVHFDARFAGKTNQSWVQIEDAGGTGTFATGGFSGGRVWSYRHEAAIGVVVAKHTSEMLRIAFMIPARTIARSLPEVPVEQRPLGPYYCQIWTLFSGAFFLFVTAHLLANRINGFPDALSLGFGNQVVAAFFGAVVGAALLPVQLLTLIRFARAFRLHDWWMRLPRFGHMTMPDRPTRSRLAAALTLFLLVVFPLYCQFHFMNAVYRQAKIYIYTGDSFGYTTGELLAMGQSCDVRTIHLCTHPDAGLFSLVSPKPLPPTEPGLPEQRRPLAYFDNTYHIGARDLPTPNSVTFFPIIEPLFVLLGTVTALFLIVRLAVLLRLPPSSRLQR
ncbi:trypsin-like peptidase domain-containing protein [Kaistia algarum]|uniref:trypsin-like peptidase domain-containing protein n=1 Tax=Kaistia algarum TaxID=2083279 RepID=UPI0014033209|nr:trypsin-like peptidase domain-containing protein [Kaistia algarum]MCX5512988.1 trypsin-like peptidase domain-containing protein [Kaistia algarum]